MDSRLPFGDKLDTLSKSAEATGSPSSLYVDLVRDLQNLLRDERDPMANAANTAALLYHALADVNWVGFYFLKGKELVLGPFQGRPACVRIPLGKGVCGTAASQRRSIIVPDVHTFPGHITCDPASRSEAVIPLLKAGELLGVLDLDSPLVGRFDAADQQGLESLASVFLSVTHFPWIEPTAGERNG